MRSDIVPTIYRANFLNMASIVSLRVRYMRFFSQVVACIIMIGLALTPVSVSGAMQSPEAVPPGSSLLSADCVTDVPKSGPLPPHPVLGRSTAHAPHRPVAKRKTVSRKPTKPAAKPVVETPVGKKPVAHTPRKVIHKQAVAGKHVKRSTAGTRPALRRVTLASPACIDRAPVMQVFGLEDVGIPSFSEEMAKAIEEELAPQNVVFPQPATTASSSGGGRSTGGFTIPPFFQGGSGGGFFPRPPAGTNPGGGGGNGGGDTPSGGGSDTPGGSEGDTSGPGGGNIVPPVALPEPSTWAFMILGFSAIGFALRRRRRESRNPAEPSTSFVSKLLPTWFALEKLVQF